MSDSGSPDLIFEPMNETDELTMITACINDEFSRIRQEEKKARITQEMTQENVWDDGWLEKIEDPLKRKIVELLLRKPEITRIKLGAQII